MQTLTLQISISHVMIVMAYFIVTTARCRAVYAHPPGNDGHSTSEIPT